MFWGAIPHLGLIARRAFWHFVPWFSKCRGSFHNFDGITEGRLCGWLKRWNKRF